MKITQEEKNISTHSTDPYGIVDASFLDAILHQGKSFIFPLIAYVMYGKLHINGVDDNKGEQKKPKKKSLHNLYTSIRRN